MKKDFMRQLRNIRDQVGDDGIEKIAEALDSKADDADKGWQKAAVRALADAVRQHGADGLDMALDRMEQALNGQDADFSFTSLRAGSDLLAELQNAEAAKRKRIEGFLQTAFNLIKKAILAAI